MLKPRPSRPTIDRGGLTPFKCGLTRECCEFLDSKKQPRYPSKTIDCPTAFFSIRNPRTLHLFSNSTGRRRQGDNLKRDHSPRGSRCSSRSHSDERDRIQNAGTTGPRNRRLRPVEKVITCQLLSRRLMSR